MVTYYNEIDPYCVEWLQSLIRAGLISPGDVDSRPIQEVSANDLRGYTRCHFFAGIAGWELALQLAEWPDDLPIWTGSCPCQPFSVAGKRKGTSDERHLWPEFLRLIRAGHPARVAGEQVASRAGREWLSGVRSDLEELGYAVGAADLCAASAGAPHIRQRLWWIAQGLDNASGPRRLSSRQGSEDQARHEAWLCGSEPGCSDGWLAHDLSPGLEERECHRRVQREAMGSSEGEAAECGGDINFWSPFDLIPCLDGKSRRVEPGPQQMVDGFSEVLARLRPGTIQEIEKEMSDAKISEADARKVLRDLWISLAESSIRRTTGRFNSVYEAPVLLAFLRELQRKGWHLLNHLPSACWQTPEDGLRAMRDKPSAPSCSPQGRESGEQYALQSGDAVSVVPQILARKAEAVGMIPFPLAVDVPARVAKLRALGNAIVPQVAAEVLSAWLDLMVDM